MADYFRNFSFEIPTEDDEQISFIKDEIRKELFKTDYYDTDDDIVWDGIDEEELFPSIWVYSDWGELDAVFVAIAEWQKKFGIKEALTVHQSLGCSKPRLDSFGGDVTVIKQGNIYHKSSNEIANDIMQSIK